MDAPIQEAQDRSTDEIFGQMTLGLIKDGSNADNSWDSRVSMLGKSEVAPTKQMHPANSLRTSTSPTAKRDSRINLWRGAFENVV